ncbi:MAG: caspase family protein [Phormidesmis sp.]
MPEFSHDLAVVIGIDCYGNGIGPLQTAVGDVEAIAHRLQQDHHYQVLPFINQQASLAALQQLLAEVLPQRVQPDSRLLFYFAGHGIALNGDDGPEGYLIPQDAKAGETSSYLSMPVLQAALSKLPCRHFLGVLDCCFAGAFRWSSTRDISLVPEVIHQERYDRFIQDPAWQIITSSAYDQRAFDVLSINTERGQVGNHSPFAAALLEALCGKADLYPPAAGGRPAGDGVITATELYLYLRERIEPITVSHRSRQTPGIWPLKNHDKGEYIFLSPGHPLNLPPAPELDKSKNPYLGLAAFESAQSDLFFGRQTLSEKLFEAVDRQPLTLVLGPSGSGKSSLVKAGLVPRILQTDANATQNRWHILPPLRLSDSNSLSGGMLEDYVAYFSQRHPGDKLLLVIDQFEELITLGLSDEKKERFVRALAQAIATHRHQLRLVLTLRSDFEPQFQESALQPYWSAARFVVPPMTRAELREAIVQPASKRVIYFQSDNPDNPLVDQIIDEVADMPGALPLLSFTLSELYLKYLQRQKTARNRGELLERTITEADYRELGGVARSLTQRADSEYQALVDRDLHYAATVRNVMLRMVAVGGTQLARRSVPLSEFEYATSEQQRVQTVIKQFSDARLLVEGTAVDGRPYVEPAHDALVLGWQKLLDWQQAEEASLLLQRRLTPAAEEWRSHQNQSSPQGIRAKADPFLNQLDRAFYRLENALNKLGTHLAQTLGQMWRQRQRDRPQNSSQQFLWNTSPYLDVFQQELKANNHRLNRLETEFVQESLLLKRRTTSWRWRLAIALILVLSGLVIAALLGRRAALIGQIRTSRNSAEVNFRAGQQLDAMQDSLNAAQTFTQPLLQAFRPSSQLKEQVSGTLQKAVYSVNERNRLSADPGRARSSLSPDGQYIVSAGEAGNVILWDWQGQQQLQWAAQQGAILTVGFSPDGETIATAGGDGSVRLWSLQGKLLADLQGHTDTVQGLSFSPNGRWLATASRDKTVRLWNLKEDLQTLQPSAVLTGHQEAVWSVAFSPDSGQLASASDDGMFRRWNLRGNQIVSAKPVSAQQGELHVIRFSPDGQRLATAGENGQIRLWTLKGEPVAVLEGHQGRVWGLAFSKNPTGKPQLASASGDGTVRLWSATKEPLTVLQSHQGPVRNVSFSPEGQRLVSSGDDGTVRLWDFQSQQQTTLNDASNGQRNLIGAIAASANGQTIATRDSDGIIRIRTAKAELLASWKEAGRVDAIALSPDGKAVAIAQNNTVFLKTLQDQQLLVKLSSKNKNSGGVKSLQISADGQSLMNAQDDGFVQLWNLQTQTASAWVAGSTGLLSAALSPDGQQIATAGEDSIIRLWNLQGKLQQQLEGHLGAVNSVAFSPSGQQLASAGEDGTIRLWNSRGEEESDSQSNLERTVFQVYSASVNSVSFSEDGKFLSSADSAGNVQLWNLANQQPFADWSAHPGAAIRTVQMNRQALTTLAHDGTAYLWPLEDFQTLRGRGCALISDYLRNDAKQDDNAGIYESDRSLCKGLAVP